MQAGGHRFDPDRLHQQDPEDEEKGFCREAGSRPCVCERFFDIVNGFFDRCRGAWVIQTMGIQSCVTTDASNLAEIIARAYNNAGFMQA